MLLATNMLDLVEVTHTKHYQAYKTKRLKEMGYLIDDNSTTIFDLYRTKRNELMEEIQKREFEIKENFVKKVKEKENEIKLTEKEVMKIKKLTVKYVLFIVFFCLRFKINLFN
jgi:septin 6/8/11